MRNKNLTAAAAMATATALMLAGCATQKPAASSSEAASTAPAESSVVEETTPEEAPSEVTDVDEAAAEDLLLSTETMHYSADDEDGVVTVHKYDENGNEVFMREISAKCRIFQKIFYDLLKKHLQFTVYCGIILLGCERLV